MIAKRAIQWERFSTATGGAQARAPRRGRMPFPRRAQQGFSLLEVLVAFAVLAVSLGVLMEIFSGGVRNAVLADRYGEALIIAESRLAAAGVEVPLKPGSQSGSEGGYDWTEEVAEYREQTFDQVDTQYTPYQVWVRVGWKEYGRNRNVELTSLRLQKLEQF